MSSGDTGGKRYIVRDAVPSGEPSLNEIHPGTLAGLVEALGSAQTRSYYGSPKVVVKVTGKLHLVIRCYEAGREVPVTG